MELDPSYTDDDVWVAEDAGRLVSTVQIFPRRLLLGGAEVPMGGVGTVYTRPEARNAGLASRLLERVVCDLRQRGAELSLLFAVRIPFYENLGWCSWATRRELLRLAEPAAPATTPKAWLRPFAAERDLAAVRELHAEESRRRPGVAVRGEREWRASLELAGNPHEEFLLAHAGTALLAYVRAIRLNEVLVVAELAARDPGALALLCASLLVPREPDPLAPAGRASAAFRSFLVLPFAARAGLARELERRGMTRQPVDDPTALLRCLDAEALGRRLGLPRQEGESERAFLARVLPPERFSYWPADRF